MTILDQDFYYIRYAISVRKYKSSFIPGKFSWNVFLNVCSYLLFMLSSQVLLFCEHLLTPAFIFIFLSGHFVFIYISFVPFAHFQTLYSVPHLFTLALPPVSHTSLPGFYFFLFRSPFAWALSVYVSSFVVSSSVLWVVCFMLVFWKQLLH